MDLTIVSNVNNSSSDSVPAADFIRRFGAWRERATTRPVLVTNHGRPTHALISIEAFEMAMASAKADGAQIDNTTLSLIETFDKVSESILIIDEDFRILLANTAARSFFIGRSNLVGTSLGDIIPNLEDSLIEANIKRTLRTGEYLSTDVRSLTQNGTWLHLESLRVPAGVAIKFRDITADIEAHRFANLKKSIVRALEIDGTVGYARISPRGMVARANSALVDMLGLSAQHVRSGKFLTMIAPSCRAEVQTLLEDLLDGGNEACCDTHILTGSGGDIPVRLSLVALRGEYACEGALAVLRPLEPGDQRAISVPEVITDDQQGAQPRQ